MAGIYLHVPFCKKICYYCDFYKTRKLSGKDSFLHAVEKEIYLQRHYLGRTENEINSIYFGGGTPSLLEAEEINKLIVALHNNFDINNEAEITLEANPEDLHPEYLKEIKNAGINRLSIGCQSFQDKYLKLMNRRHNAEQSLSAVRSALDSGFDNISIDLIYGLPGMSRKEWEKTLQTAMNFPVVHISAYHLTIEKNTVFYHWFENGKIKMPEEEDSLLQYKLLMDYAEKYDYEHYEISSFAKSGKYAKHNMAYWFQEKYLGLGPAAHSYNKKGRKWNIANVEKYTEGVLRNKKYSEEEHLDIHTRFNEFLLTRLRTKWGFNRKEIIEKFGVRRWEILEREMTPYIDTGTIRVEDGVHYRIAEEGFFVSDLIISNLFAA